MIKLIWAFLLFTLGQTLIWIQTNGQFVWPWFKKNPLSVALIFAIPISYSFIIATKFIVEYFDGTLWPGRFIGFAMGITSFAIMTNFYMNEGISTKTAVSLVLATTLVAIQILWK